MKLPPHTFSTLCTNEIVCKRFAQNYSTDTKRDGACQCTDENVSVTLVAGIN
jgi:hypothetical protein